MQSVWKYPLKVDDYQTIEMPRGAQILTVETQYDKPCLWALVDPRNDLTPRRFRMAGTGHPIEDIIDLHNYVGTFQMMGGQLIFHLFEVAC